MRIRQRSVERLHEELADAALVEGPVGAGHGWVCRIRSQRSTMTAEAPAGSCSIGT